MPIQPTPQTATKDLSYQYYQHAGVPFAGTPPAMYRDEYDKTVQRVGKTGYGIFDMRNTDDEHCGRTLKHILDRAYVQEYEILTMEPYNNGVVDDPNQPPAIFMLVMWVEKIDTLSEHAKELSQKNS